MTVLKSYNQYKSISVQLKPTILMLVIINAKSSYRILPKTINKIRLSMRLF